MYFGAPSMTGSARTEKFWDRFHFEEGWKILRVKFYFFNVIVWSNFPISAIFQMAQRGSRRGPRVLVHKIGLAELDQTGLECPIFSSLRPTGEAPESFKEGSFGLNFKIS